MNKEQTVHKIDELNDRVYNIAHDLIKEIKELKATLGETEIDEEEQLKKEIIRYASSHMNDFYSPNHITFEGSYLKLPLPNCNQEWTFRVWDCVKALCEKYPGVYPIHHSFLNTADYQYVECNGLLSEVRE